MKRTKRGQSAKHLRALKLQQLLLLPLTPMTMIAEQA
jgi:hypothetical protein